MTEIFRPAFVQAASDKLIDRPELEQLRGLKNQLQRSAPGSEEARTAARTLQSLDAYKGFTRVNQPVQQADGKTVYFDFTLTPTYGEKERVPGKTPFEIVSNLSQGDNLADTREDNNRCGAASLINAYLLLGGDFAQLPEKLGLKLENNDLTYENAHRVQEALYVQANTNGSRGLNLSEDNRYDRDSGRLLQPRVVGESRIAAGKIGLTTHALTGPTYARRTEREQAIREFIAKHPKAPMYVTVKGGPPPTAPADFELYDHAVTIYHEKGQFWLFDTGVDNNGASQARRQLSQAEVKSLLYDNKGFVFGLSLEGQK